MSFIMGGNKAARNGTPKAQRTMHKFGQGDTLKVYKFGCEITPPA